MSRGQQRATARWSTASRSAALGAVVRGSGAVALVLVPSAALLWLVWLSGIGLRDQRYLDGWMLAAGLCVQLCFHIATRMGRLSPKAAARWRRIHIHAGYVVIVSFLSHLGSSLPDTAFEWALATAFALVAASGVASTYLSWSLRTRRSIDPALTLDGIEARRRALARDAEATAIRREPVAPAILPAPPYDSWIADLYGIRLRGFFASRRNTAAHLVGSRRPSDRLTAEIDELSRYLDEPGRAKLAAIRALVMEKDQLDVAAVHIGLGEAWLLIHVPLTYALIVMSVLHIAVVYAFTARPW